MNNKDMIGRYDALHSERNNVQQLWDGIRRYIMPYRGHFFREQNDESSIDWNQRHVYDSTAPMAHKTLSATIHAGMSSPSIKWFDMRFRDESLNNHNLSVKWIQEVSDRAFFELQDSNFNLQVNETYQDICGFGTSFISLEEYEPDSKKWTGLNFSSVPLKEGVFEEDAWGRILRFYRLVKWSPQQIISKFGDLVPQSVKDKEKGNSTTKMDVLFCIYPRNNNIAAPEIRDWGKTLSPSKRTWEYRYILKSSGETLGRPGGYYEMPTFAPRWEKTSESMWGNSPASIALWDVLSLNEAREMQLRMAEKIIDPPVMAEERSIISDLDLSAGSLNVVRNVAGVLPFNSQGSWPVSAEEISQLQASVRNYFYVDQLQFPAPQAQPMTATEAQIRFEQMNRLMATAMSRIRNDMLDPIVGRVVRMLARKGQLPEPPSRVVEMNAQLEIEYMGSVSRAQRADQAASIERVVAFAGSMAEVLPDALDSIDVNEAMNWIGRDLNVPAGIMRGEEEVEQIQEERRAQQQAMMTAQQAQEAGAGMEAMAEGQNAMEGTNGPQAAPTGTPPMPQQ